MRLRLSKLRWCACAIFAVAVLTPSTTACQGQRERAPQPRIDAVSLALSELPARVKRTRQLDATIAQLRRGRMEPALESWSAFVTDAVGSKATQTDIAAVQQWALRQSYLETNQDLADHAGKVKFYNDAKKAVRDELTSARGDLRSAVKWPIVRRAVTIRKSFAAKQGPIARTENRSFSRAELESYLADLEKQLQSAGDDAQLANLDLQNALQKQQQTLQSISNASKRMHDTAMAIIRKIGG